jgi:hypothetical protein
VKLLESKAKFRKVHSNINPYFFFVITFLITVILYSFDFSEFNVPLGAKVISFLIIAMALNFILYLLFRKRWSEAAVNAQKNNGGQSVNTYTLWAIVFLGLGIADVLYSHGMPLLGQVNYKEYGFPTLHVLMVVCDSFLLLSIAKTYFLTNVRRVQLLFTAAIALLPLVFGLSRGTIVILLLSILMIFLLTFQKKITIKLALIIGLLLAFGLYLFGITGNYRMNHDYGRVENLTESSLILSIGKANNKFTSSGIPKPFYWTYIYATSPIANFRYNTEVSNPQVNTANVSEFLVTNFLPDFISKRVFPTYEDDYRAWLMTNEFTVTTAFTLPYTFLGWMGVYIFLIYSLVFPIVYLELIRKFSPGYFDLALVLLSTIYILMPFSNFFSFSALSIQLFLPFICSLFSRRRDAKRNYEREETD